MSDKGSEDANIVMKMSNLLKLSTAFYEL